MSCIVNTLRILSGLSQMSEERQGNRAVSTWRDYPGALTLLLSCSIEEMRERGCDYLPDPYTPEGQDILGVRREFTGRDPEMPAWLGMRDLHVSHQSALMEADRKWYVQFGWSRTQGDRMIFPPPMPKVGDFAACRDGTVGVVDTVGRTKILVFSEREQRMIDVAVEDFLCGRWKRAVSQER